MQTDSIRVVIVEDQLSTRESLKFMLNDMGRNVEIVGEAGSAALAYEVIVQTEPQLVFLDVELTDDNSFSLLEKFDKPTFNAVFITAHDEYAIKAIKFSALDYLLKPIDPTELEGAVNRYLQKTASFTKKRLEVLVHNTNIDNKTNQKIALSSAREIYFATLSEIIKLEGEKNYTTFYLNNGKKVTVSKTLKEYEELLEDFGFFRVHQSYIVNLSRISKYLKGKGGYAVMDDGSTVEISVRRRDDFLRNLQIG